VGRDARGVVERAGADEPDRRAGVAAEDRDLAGRAAEDPLLLAAAARNVDRLRLAREQLDAVGLDQQVDDERAAGLPLAIQAVAAVREERLGRKPVANLSAPAAAFEHVGHDPGLFVKCAGSRRGGGAGATPSSTSRRIASRSIFAPGAVARDREAVEEHLEEGEDRL